jgi:glycosyltransferase involved in cell wall biosynthesis
MPAAGVTDEFRASIGGPPQAQPRPLWSVMIPAYNCARFLRDSLASVLAQDMGPELMQIEVVDDHSTRDDPGAVVESLGRGRVGFFRQPTNQGVTGNLNTCLQRARGSLVHLLHGDDLVRDGFYRRMQQPFEDRPEIGAAFCRQIFIDEAGRWLSISPLDQDESGLFEDGVRRLATEQRIMTPSIVVRREVYERLGGFDRRLICSEDWEMWVRIAAHYPIAYEIEPLALYRMHGDSNTGRHLRTGEDVRYTRDAIDIFEKYLAPDVARSVTGRARETYALAALRCAETMLRRRDAEAMSAQIREALKLSHSGPVLRRTLRLWLHGVARLGPAMLANGARSRQ